MRPFNPRSMAIDILELIRFLPLARRKKRLHLLPWLQADAAPGRSSTGGSTGTGSTVAYRKLHLSERLAEAVLHWCPARTDPSLRTGDGLCLPIDRKAGDIVARLRLIPVGFEGGANQINSMGRLRFDQIDRRDISRIDEMLIGKQFLLSKIGIKRGKDSLIA